MEPGYPTRASRELVGGSVLGKGERRVDVGWSSRSEGERVEMALELHEAAELGELGSRRLELRSSLSCEQADRSAP